MMVGLCGEGQDDGSGLKKKAVLGVPPTHAQLRSGNPCQKYHP